MAIMRTLPVERCGTTGRERQERHADVAAEQVVHRSAAAAIGHVLDVDARLLAEQQTGEVMRRAGARRAVAQLARDWPSHRRSRPPPDLTGSSAFNRKADDVHARIGDRREVPHGIEARVPVEMQRCSPSWRRADHQRVAVRRARERTPRRCCRPSPAGCRRSPAGPRPDAARPRWCGRPGPTPHPGCSRSRW